MEIKSMELQQIIGVAEARERINSNSCLILWTADDMNMMLSSLLEFPVGRILFDRKKWDFELNVLFSHQRSAHGSNNLLNWVQESDPELLSYREHLEISKREVLQIAKPNSTLAFFPTGIMYNLLRLEESVLSVHEISLIGLDFDEGSFLATKRIAESSQYANNIHFVLADAWHLDAFENQFDVLTSYGLNLYVSEESKLIDLYKEFFKAIKPGGTLITSFFNIRRHEDNNCILNNITDSESTKTCTEMNENDMKSYILYNIIIGSPPQFRISESAMISHLETAGFERFRIVYDNQKIHPTVIAHKPDPRLISHTAVAPLAQLEQEARDRIDAYFKSKNPCTMSDADDVLEDCVSREEALEMLSQLLEHPIGRSFFQRKGWDGIVTRFMLSSDVKTATVSGTSDIAEASLVPDAASTVHTSNPLLDWFRYQAPNIQSNKERFRFFQTELQSIIDQFYRNTSSLSLSIASVPCGVMDDLLGLRLDVNNSSMTKIMFTGIDLDERSLAIARESADMKNLSHICKFYQADAWHLDVFENQFDVLTSYGLNLYVSEESKLIDLYKEFFKAIKPGGTLMTSFLNLPSDVIRHRNESRDYVKSYILSKVIVDATYRNFRGETSMRYQLEQAGFEVTKVLYDKRRIHPTIVVIKPKFCKL